MQRPCQYGRRGEVHALWSIQVQAVVPELATEDSDNDILYEHGGLVKGGFPLRPLPRQSIWARCCRYFSVAFGKQQVGIALASGANPRSRSTQTGRPTLAVIANEILGATTIGELIGVKPINPHTFARSGIGARGCASFLRF